MTDARATFRVLLVVAALIAAVLVPTAAQPERAEALSAADWDPGYIISDENFYNGAAMSEAEIQRFLETTVGTCQNSNCLAVYREDTPTRTWSFGTCSTYVGAAGESAARIIFKVQQACNLSAKVILVTLQKEQSLVTNRAPSDGIMRKAMGYGCPDTAACDSTYYGFFNQIFAAGRQLTWYGNPAGSFTSIRVGQFNAIQYHPNAGCGTKDVLVRNRATAALYYYTPYTPNAAAMANLGGIGDSCSAYGNRNFWVFYSNWFGPTTGSRDPMAYVDTARLDMSATEASILISGWAMDPADRSRSIEVHVYVDQPDGTTQGFALAANGSRPDVAAAYPGAGEYHGYSLRAPVRMAGTYKACVFPITGGAGWLLGCHTFEARPALPIGSLDSVDAEQTATEARIVVGGWAFDSAAPSSISQVHVYVDRPDGTTIGRAVEASAARPDVGSVFPAAGPNHGFVTTVLVDRPGTYRVCAFAIGASPFGSTSALLGCRSLVFGPSSPIGVLDGAWFAVSAGGAGAIAFSGWAIDNGNPTTAIPVHVYVDYPDGRVRGVALTSDLVRDDVARAFPGAGPSHGFAGSAPADLPGRYRVCAYAIGRSAFGSTNAGLGCRQVDVGGAPATGALDAVAVSRSPEGVSTLTVDGWSFDPASPATANQVHVYVDRPDGVTTGIATTADRPRPDVGAVFPHAGPGHGFTRSGTHPDRAHTTSAHSASR